MGLTAEESNPWVIPAMNVAFNRKGYVLVGCRDVTMVEDHSPEWNTSVLHYKSVAKQSNILVWLGSMGWDSEGHDAHCDYKLFRVDEGREIPERLYFSKVEHFALYWSWSAPYSYDREPFGNHLIKPETVHWQPYKEIGFR